MKRVPSGLSDGLRASLDRLRELSQRLGKFATKARVGDNAGRVDAGRRKAQGDRGRFDHPRRHGDQRFAQMRVRVHRARRGVQNRDGLLVKLLARNNTSSPLKEPAWLRAAGEQIPLELDLPAPDLSLYQPKEGGAA